MTPKTWEASGWAEAANDGTGSSSMLDSAGVVEDGASRVRAVKFCFRSDPENVGAACQLSVDRARHQKVYLYYCCLVG